MTTHMAVDLSPGVPDAIVRTLRQVGLRDALRAGVRPRHIGRPHDLDRHAARLLVGGRCTRDGELFGTSSLEFEFSLQRLEPGLGQRTRRLLRRPDDETA